MDPSRVAGAVANGRAVEGPALAQAVAEGEAPPTLGAALAAAFFFLPKEKVMSMLNPATELIRRAETASFMVVICWIDEEVR